jgi:cytochrome P450
VLDNDIRLDNDFLQDPHAFYAALRDTGPVRSVVLGNGLRAWLVTDYAQARAALANPTLNKDIGRAADLVVRHTENRAQYVDLGSLSSHMLNSDPPDHTRLRKLVNKAFTPGAIDHLRPRIEEITAELLTAMADADKIDLLAAFAFPLPITVICELLGIPTEDRADFRSWSEVVMSNDRTSKLADNAAAMTAYLAGLIETKRATPGQDLLSNLINARDDNDHLTDEELVAMAFLLLVAGHETTVNLLGNAVLALLTNPDQLAALRNDPSLVSGAVDEFLRFDGPVAASTLRFTTQPVTIGDTEIPAEEFVVVALSAANRDPARFADPDTLDITRSGGGHLGFGHGIHFCVGAPLARMEAEIALSRLLAAFPDMTLIDAPTDLLWRDSTVIRGLHALNVNLR